MKLFAPRNNWDVKDPESGWGRTGNYGTSSGLRVTEASAMTLSSVLAATRVLSEALASLPCNTLEQVDYRTTKKAISHSLWSILHDQPNPEQDIMSWMDMQVAFQVNWGNAYAEIQRNSLGQIVALWSIHPSRIPVKNIVRNGNTPFSYQDIIVGQPGEIVYFVNNDDGSQAPIAASDMFHVAGVLSTNGVTGQSLVKWGANAIGAAMAAEQHATAVFKNGAVSNIALKHPKTLSDGASARLRQEWTETYAGVQNHYKALILEEGMEPVPINMSPEATQLILARQFGVTDVARVYRVQPHMIGDLTRATNNNIENESLSFVTYTMLPWIIRWEKAMYRQLLSIEEKKKYRFKFNVDGLLRGDQAARGAYFQILFNLGAMSPNDIREKDDMNPVEGGDQYFVQGNNVIPLDKIGELTQAKIDKAKAPPPAKAPPASPNDAQADSKSHITELRQQMLDMITEYETRLPAEVAAAVNFQASDKAVAREIIAESAMQAVRESLTLAIQGEADQLMKYEARAAREAAKKPQTFLSWRDEFYPKFTTKLAAAIHVFSPAAAKIGVLIDGTAEAEAYVGESLASLVPLESLTCDQLESGVDKVMESWGSRPQQLAEALFRSAA